MSVKDSKTQRGATPLVSASEAHLSEAGPWDLAVLPTRSPALFPHSLAPLTVGRPASLAALDAVGENQLLAVFAQKDPAVEVPTLEDLHSVGCAGLLLRLAQLEEDEATRIALVEGVRRIHVVEILQREPYLKVKVEVLHDRPDEIDAEYAALERNIRELFEEIVAASPALTSDVLTLLRSRRDASALADYVAANLPSLGSDTRQELLENLDVRSRMKRLVEELLKEREQLRMRDKIRDEVGKRISETQRHILLREQLRAIQRELGEGDEADRDLDELEKQLRSASLPEAAQKEADRELHRLRQIPPASAEYTVSRTYLDWLAALPWREPSNDLIDLSRAREILNQDHYDLDKVKERILEHIAVIALRKTIKGPILCFVGPPGVGKTSIGQSIARAMGRPFARISLGGMRDEAEIRGHRRTYVGALPGQIIRAIRQAGSRDPIVMLDEVDKIGSDFRGDPASALLEVLDPAQNNTFRDHYLDVPFDLSRVVFITTANVLEPIPPALYDRMEVIELAGYADEEKVEIAHRYLVPRSIESHGLTSEQIEFSDEAIAEIVQGYTHEAGVRDLERQVAAICRKQAARILGGATGKLVVDVDTPAELLGPRRFRMERDLERRTNTAGVAVALAWTPYGGEILFVEAARVARDRGEFSITGQVQKVMEESARAALTWLRAHSEEYGISPAEFRDYDVHVHVPAGAVPKDGPSAGIVMVAALVSLFAQQPVRSKLALTGEITLSGHILAVGGIKEKVLAAKRSGITDIVLPEQNRSNVAEDIPPHLREGLSFHFVETIEEAILLAFAPVDTRGVKTGSGTRRKRAPANGPGAGGAGAGGAAAASRRRGRR